MKLFLDEPLKIILLVDESNERGDLVNIKNFVEFF